MTERTSRFGSDSLTVRGLAVAAIALLMLVPVSMVRSVVDERFALYQGVVGQIGAEWGGPQVVAGPVLLIPFTERWTTRETIVTESGDVREIQRAESRSDVLTVLPDALAIDAPLDVERRQRGIYEAMVYTSHISMKGRFAPPDPMAAPGKSIELHWSDAVLSLGASAPVGIRSVALPVLSGGARAPEPGTMMTSMPQGMHWRLRDAETLADSGEFEISLVLNGSEQVAFVPLGATTQATIASHWPHPSFVGLMPAERSVDDEGFNASYSVSSLSRSYPQQFDQTHAPPSLAEISIGVRLMQPVFLYSLNDRAVKYAVLFITLTFATLLVFELVTAARVHFVQYGLIGAALALFYLLLLALSEHIGFGWAYTIAATAIVSMITACSAAALSGWRHAALVGAMQAVTYSVLYVVLRARRLRADHRHDRTARCTRSAHVLHAIAGLARRRFALATGRQSMIKIYHAPGTRSIRAIWLCEELEIPYEVAVVDFSAAYRATAEWRRLNPVGKVPAMIDDDFSMFESGAMVEYLLERYGGGRLRPERGTRASAAYLQWSWFAEATFARPLGDIAQHTVVKPERDRIPAVVEDARTRALTCMDALEAEVVGGHYLVSDRFTAADIMMGYTLVLARRFNVLTPTTYSNVNAYMKRLESHAGFIKAQK